MAGIRWWPQQAEWQQFESVLDGAVEFHIEYEVHQLAAGDSILFDASRPHSRRNLSRTKAARVLIASKHPELD